jgi:SAM-dependent methyltransferase
MNVQTDADALQKPIPTSLGHCRLCGTSLHRTVVDLGMSPPCEKILLPHEIDGLEEYYPLHVLVCDECLLVQLKEYVGPEAIFSEYCYFSSYSTSLVELASNDGYLLQHFLPLGVGVLGVEPAANVAEAARRLGIPTRVEFFGEACARRLLADGFAADLIVGNNVLAHVPDLNDFVSGVVRLLKPEGTATFEFPHLERLFDENQFDTIYHEHFSYFSLLTIEKLAARHQLVLYDVDEIASHGGSVRIYLAHAASGRTQSPKVREILTREVRGGFDDPSTYAAFEERARATKRDLLKFLIAAKEAGKTVVGYGAPGKGNTLLNYCGVGRDFIDFTVDRNPYKHGRFTPGMHLPIRPVEAIDEARPDYILILPWNLKREIVSQMSHVAEWGAKFVTPIPRVEVIGPEEFLP